MMFSKLGSEFSGPLTAVVVVVIIVAFLLSISFSLCFNACTGRREQVGSTFCKCWKSDNRFTFQHLKADTILQPSELCFMYRLYIFLWSLCSLIPGIIKGYSYMMVYIKSENPNLSADECINMSRQMTDGHHADLFYLDLSFIGWFILSICTCCILEYFVCIRIIIRQKRAYEALKAEANKQRQAKSWAVWPADGGYHVTTGY